MKNKTGIPLEILEQLLEKKKEAERIKMRERALEHQWYFNELMERNLKQEEKFFTRDKKHLIVISILFDLVEQGHIWQLALALPPRYGKSYSVTMAMLRTIALNPNKANMRNSYNEDLAVSFSSATRDMIASEEFSEIFPEIKLSPNKKSKAIWYLEGKTINAMSAAGVGGGANGKDASNFLVLDDEFRNMTDAYSKAVQEMALLFNLSVHEVRGTENTKHIYVCTRWILNDTIGRKLNSMKEFRIDYEKYVSMLVDCSDEDIHGLYLIMKDDILAFEDSCKVSDISYKHGAICHMLVPLLDSKNKSTCEAIRSTDNALAIKNEHMRNGKMNEFYAVQQQNPVPKEGLMYTVDDLQWFFDDEIEYLSPLDVLAYCDPAFGGGDSLSMPVGYKSNDGMYIVDWVFSRKGTMDTIKMVRDAVIRNNVSVLRIEGNRGGSEFAIRLKDLFQSQNIRCRVRIIKSNSNKVARMDSKSGIIMNSFHFRDMSQKCNEQYQEAIKELLSMPKDLSLAEHDDALDSLAGLADMVTSRRTGGVTLF